MEPNKVAIIIRDENNQWEGLRSALGLGLEMIEAHMFVIGKVQIAAERVEGYKESLEFLSDDLECMLYTDHRPDVEKWGFFEYMTMDEVARKLSEYDLIIPF